MTEAREMRSPGAVNAEAHNRNQKHLSIVAENTRPRPRWRGNPPFTVLSMSPEMVSYFYDMADAPRVGWISRRCRVSQSHAATVEALAFPDREART